MSVKVTKIAQTKDWIDEIADKIKATINEGAELRIDLSLLPQNLQEMFKQAKHTSLENLLIPLRGGRNKEILSRLSRTSYYSWPHGIPQEINEYLEKLIDRLSLLSQKSENAPIRMSLSAGDLWAFKGFIYKVEYKKQVRHSHEEELLLVLAYYDQERQKFEKLKQKYKSDVVEKESYRRERISEEVRIAVWRRDDGKCARCGSREKLEYDHIVPVSKGGGNTARNIGLLCESCNRKKHNNIE
ncbi:MAG: HNH endonuclease [Anaerolineales bacterium]|nr:HNH endonuclease [Anaerolineales bacterium]